jgi:hypothetical protein
MLSAETGYTFLVVFVEEKRECLEGLIDKSCWE